jgi:hypothetical protein
MSRKKHKKQVRSLTRAEIQKKIRKKVVTDFNDRVEAKIRNPKTPIDKGFKKFKPRGPGRLKPPTGQKTSDYD